jgi:hypothetical protein
MVDLASVVRPGDGIICGQACAEPQTIARGAGRAARATLRMPRVPRRELLRDRETVPLRPSAARVLRRDRPQPGVVRRRRARRAARSLFAARRLIRSGQIPADVVFVQVEPAQPARRIQPRPCRGLSRPGLADVPDSRRRSECTGAVDALGTPAAPGRLRSPRRDIAHPGRGSRSHDRPRDRASCRRARRRRQHDRVRHRRPARRGLRVPAERKGLRVHSGTIGDGVVDLMRAARSAKSIAPC